MAGEHANGHPDQPSAATPRTTSATGVAGHCHDDPGRAHAGMGDR